MTGPRVHSERVINAGALAPGSTQDLPSLLLQSFLNEECFILKALGNTSIDTSYGRHNMGHS